MTRRGVSEIVAQHIRALMAVGTLKAGNKLRTERTIAPGPHAPEQDSHFLLRCDSVSPWWKTGDASV